MVIIPMPESDLGMSAEDYRRAEGEIRKAVATGRVSEEHAEVHLVEMRKMIVE